MRVGCGRGAQSDAEGFSPIGAGFHGLAFVVQAFEADGVVGRFVCLEDRAARLRRVGIEFDHALAINLRILRHAGAGQDFHENAIGVKVIGETGKQLRTGLGGFHFLPGAEISQRQQGLQVGAGGVLGQRRAHLADGLQI